MSDGFSGEKSVFIKTEAQREYNKQWRLKNKERVKEYNKEYNKNNQERIKRLAHKRNTQRIRFKGPQIDLDFNPRTGVCMKCHKSKHLGEIKQTHLHHEKYDESNPLNYTIELCVSCHNKERVGIKHAKR